MFRDTKKPVDKSITINVLIADGGMGDLVGAIPALRYLVATQTWINPLIWCPDYMVDFAKHFLPKGTSVRGYSEAKTKFNDKLVGITTQWRAHKTPMRTHQVDYGYMALLDRIPYNNEERSSPRVRAAEVPLDHFNLPVKYVVIPGAATEIVKTMPVDTANQIVDYVKSKGYEVVFIGQEKTDNGVASGTAKTLQIDFSKGLNLINKTNLLELAAIIDGSAAFIGMDGGPLHVAGYTQAKIVAGFTFASPNHILPIRDGVPGKDCYPVVPDEKKIPCRFCQTNWSLLYNHDFRNCLYKDYACTAQMTFDKFKVEIDKVL